MRAATAQTRGWTGGLRLTFPDGPLRIPHPRWPPDDSECPRVARGGAGHSESCAGHPTTPSGPAKSAVVRQLEETATEGSHCCQWTTV